MRLIFESYSNHFQYYTLICLFVVPEHDMLRPAMKTIRNITRFTYEFTSFQGWRVTLCRNQVHFTRYFSDKQYGGEGAALEAALATRNMVLARLREYPDEPERAFELCREEQQQTCYPRGLRPRKNMS